MTSISQPGGDYLPHKRHAKSSFDRQQKHGSMRKSIDFADSQSKVANTKVAFD